MKWFLQGPWWRRILCWFFLAVSLFWLFSKLFWESTFLDLPEMAANLYARENCVCVFVVGQSEGNCLEITRQFVPLGSIEIDREKKIVSTRVLWAISRAKFRDERLGCVIDVP